MNFKQKIGRYEVIRLLGRGSQGSVFFARDTLLDRHVAVKILTVSCRELGRLASDGTPIEARISSKLQHPNIVSIYDAGQCPLGPYLVYEFVEGDTLDKHLKSNGPCSMDSAVPLITDILKAASAAHALGIAHLDIKPQNVLLDAAGKARIMDFGLSRFASHQSSPLETVTGTLRYMAPEHFLRQALGPPTDVFALGCTFYELVTGHLAIQGDRVQQIRSNILDANVDLAHLKTLPHGKAFARFLAGGFVKEIEGRYKDGADMLVAFNLFLDDCGLSANASGAAPNHSTVEFLLRRMERKQDFPAISSTLASINRLTNDASTASADRLTNIILRDFALTSKLLKLVNTAFYGTRSTKITNISQAVIFLGFNQVRATANSLMLFGHLKGDSAIMKDSMIKSFLGGLIARHLAKLARIPGTEEAFICGLCRNLGENLALYYFPEDYDDVADLMHQKTFDKITASRRILGVSYGDLGAAVAKTWNFPETIIDSIRGMPPGEVTAPAGKDDKIRDLAVFANALCDVFTDRKASEIDAAIRSLLMDFSPSVTIDEAYCLNLISAGFEKLTQYAPIYELNIQKSRYCQVLNLWLQNTPRMTQTAGLPAAN